MQADEDAGVRIGTAWFQASADAGTRSSSIPMASIRSHSVVCSHRTRITYTPVRDVRPRVSGTPRRRASSGATPRRRVTASGSRSSAAIESEIENQGTGPPTQTVSGAASDGGAGWGFFMLEQISGSKYHVAADFPCPVLWAYVASSNRRLEASDGFRKGVAWQP